MAKDITAEAALLRREHSRLVRGGRARLRALDDDQGSRRSTLLATRQPDGHWALALTRLIDFGVFG